MHAQKYSPCTGQDGHAHLSRDSHGHREQLRLARLQVGLWSGEIVSDRGPDRLAIWWSVRYRMAGVTEGSLAFRLPAVANNLRLARNVFGGEAIGKLAAQNGDDHSPP